jgi:hypothetical protein
LPHICCVVAAYLLRIYRIFAAYLLRIFHVFFAYFAINLIYKINLIKCF